MKLDASRDRSFQIKINKKYQKVNISLAFTKFQVFMQENNW